MFIVAGANAADSGDVNERDMYKQLAIMSDIIKSSVSDSSSVNGAKINRIQSTYLRGQGVVFTIDSAIRLRQRHNFNYTLPALPPLPVMPVSPEKPIASVHQSSNDLDVHITETIENAFESATEGYEQAMEAFEMAHEQQRDLQEQQRDIAYQIRDIEREKRDTNFQLSRANEQQKVKLESALTSLNKQVELLRVEKRKLTQANNQFVEKQKAQQRASALERTKYFKNLTVSLADTLCLYGNGLRALPNNEHVSIILKSAGDKSGHRYKDNILVFDKKDITLCSSDKIDVAKLLGKSQQYQF